MPLRPAKFSDHHAIAETCSAAFFDEDLFGRTMHPRRHDYPDGPALYWHKHIRDHWFDWRNKIFVAYKTDGKEGSQETIVGVAIWQRQGEGGKRMELSRIDPRGMLAPFSRLVNTFNSYIYPNRALDPSTLNLLSSALPFSAHYWSGNRAENWYLSLCAVNPSHQGGGFGRELVEWGIREADKEGIHASVMSSAGNDNFYLRCGFDEVVGNAAEGEGNPLAGVKGGNILFRWPRGPKSEMLAQR